jgi:putative oxidoreductase
MLVLRLVVGGVVSARGARTVITLFGGRRPSPGALLRAVRSRTDEAGMLAVGALEFGAGLLFASGLLTSLAALAIGVLLLGSIRIGDARDAFWKADVRSEVALTSWAAAVAVAAAGAGRFSLDAAIGWSELLSGLGWGVAVLVTPFLVHAGKARFARRAARLRDARPGAEKAGVEHLPDDAGERAGANQSKTRLFRRPARPPRALGLGLAQAPSEHAKRIPPVEIQLSDADDATDLIDCLWRYGLGGRLVESGKRWAVEVESPHPQSHRVLTDVVETIEIWLLECDRPGLLIRVDESRAAGQTSSAPTDGVPA